MVTKVKGSVSAPPLHFASLFRGFYGRIARQLELDPSYVSRVARGERQSAAIEAALEREMSRILRLAGNQSQRRQSQWRQSYRRQEEATREEKELVDSSIVAGASAVAREAI